MWIGMMLPMSVSDGPGGMPTWPEVRAVAQHAEAWAWTPHCHHGAAGLVERPDGDYRSFT